MSGLGLLGRDRLGLFDNDKLLFDIGDELLFNIAEGLLSDGEDDGLAFDIADELLFEELSLEEEDGLVFDIEDALLLFRGERRPLFNDEFNMLGKMTEELGRLLMASEEEACSDVSDIFSTGDAVWIAEMIEGSVLGDTEAVPSFFLSSLPPEALQLLEPAVKK